MKNIDFIVIGAGMSGAAAAYYLAEEGKTILLERESVPGYHSTGRSAAIFSEHHGPAIVCKLARASYDFLNSPPEGFSSTDLLTEKGILFTGTTKETDIADKMCVSYFKGQSTVEKIDSENAKKLVPFVRDEFLATPAYYKDAKEIDVAALHQAFLAGAKKRGCENLVNQEVVSIKKSQNGWIVRTKTGEFLAKKVINAAGAWADKISEMAGFQALGITPKRRTVVSADLPEEYQNGLYPMVVFHDQKLYFKTENGQVLISPMDTTPSEPTDSIAEEIDIATASYIFEERTGIPIRKLTNTWAGLRSFFADGAPILEDADNSGFIWLAGQGGYGIKIAEAMGRITCAIALEKELPQDVQDLGITLDDLSSIRLQEESKVFTKLS